MLWLCFGNLNNGSSNAGLSCLNGNNALSTGNWNYLARKSGLNGTHHHRAAAPAKRCRRQWRPRPEGEIDGKEPPAGRARRWQRTSATVRKENRQ